MTEYKVNELEILEQINLMWSIAAVLLAAGLGVSAVRALSYGDNVYSLVNMIFALGLTAIIIALVFLMLRKAKLIHLPLSRIFSFRRRVIPGEEGYMEFAFGQAVFNAWLFTLIVEALFLAVSRIKIFPGTFYLYTTLSLLFGVFGISYLLIYFRSEKINSAENAHE